MNINLDSLSTGLNPCLFIVVNRLFETYDIDITIY